MNTSLTAFKEGVEDLRWHMELIERERNAIALLKDATVDNDPEKVILSWVEVATKGSTPRKQFDYSCIIISLYGILEQYIEELIIEYTTTLNRLISKYSDLPDPIRDHHIDLTFELIKRMKSNRYRGASNEISTIAYLNSCLADSESYRLNHEAFALHSSNFRQKSITDIFQNIGITNICQQVSYSSEFSDYLASFENGRSELSDKETFFYLDDLAERRNQVAHGRSNDLLGFDLLKDYLCFIEAFGKALSEICQISAIEHETRIRGVDLGSPIAVYDNRIVCIKSNNNLIKIGDMLVAITQDTKRPILYSIIKSIQFDKESINQVSPDQDLAIGIEVFFNAKETHNYYLIQQIANTHIENQE